MITRRKNSPTSQSSTILFVLQVRQQLDDLQAEVDKCSAARDFASCDALVKKMRIIEYKYRVRKSLCLFGGEEGAT